MDEITIQFERLCVPKKDKYGFIICDSFPISTTAQQHLQEGFLRILKESFAATEHPLDHFLDKQREAVGTLLQTFAATLPTLKEPIAMKLTPEGYGQSLYAFRVPLADGYHASVELNCILSYTDGEMQCDQDDQFCASVERTVVHHVYREWYVISAVLEK